MISIYSTETFDDWFKNLRDKQAQKRIQVRVDRAEEGTTAITNPLAKAFLKCESITAQGIAFILSNVV